MKTMSLTPLLAQPTTQPAAAFSISTEAHFLLQTARPGLWLTTVFFYLVPVAHTDVLHSGTFWLGLVYLLFPFCWVIYGLNDYVDAEADQHNPRKGTFLFGARGSREQLKRLPTVIALSHLPFLVAFWVMLGPRVLLWFGGLTLAVWLYNSTYCNWRSKPGLDVLSQTAYLLVFVLSSWINHVPQLGGMAMLLGALFAMHSHLFGEVMDIKPDQLSGRRTLAVLLGRVHTKLLLASMLALESALSALYLQLPLVTLGLACGALWFLLDAYVFWKDQAYSLREIRLFIYGWNFVCAVAIGWLVWN